ncbi:MAG: chemotaxis protein CheW [Planctomycetes bacterium]|nr:chemotaxis protein CheW [Planctomycetota bacterium]
MSTTIQASNNSRTTSRTDDGNHDKFLTFCLGREEYGLPILAVREIIGLIDVTPLPQTPSYVKGVINLRGKIIPVIELRAKFGLPTVAYTAETCILVVEVESEEGAGAFQLGIIVDSVREVLDISRSNIEPPPNFGTSIPLSAIQGMGKVKDKVVILLDINSVGAAQGLEKLTTDAESVHATPGAAGSIGLARAAA